MQSDVFFTVVIPTYNRADRIQKTVDSVLQQGFSSFELLVVDDGSTDETSTVVAAIRDARLKYIRIDNVERGAARNVGVRKSTGVYVTFLDSDDILYPMHLEYAYRTVKADSFPEVYHQGYVIKNEVGKVRQLPTRKSDLGKLLFTRGNVMSCAGVFVKRDIMLKNLFNENRDLAGFEDWELWIRLAAKYTICYNCAVTAVLLDHRTRSSVSSDRQALENRCAIFLNQVLANEAARTKYGRLLDQLVANVYSYLSLHLSTSSSEKAIAWTYLTKAIRKYKPQLLRRRTWVILRNLLLM